MASKKPILLRISHELWEQLQQWAESDLRSLNGQIEFILREAVRKRTGKNVPETPDSSNESSDD
ncbi:Arc family DNA binding domain-containing protein [cyanobacterium TDX16]|nr:Arc family DNA binding domain-containing protein [cyanobacterium TDX16]